MPLVTRSQLAGVSEGTLLQGQYAVPVYNDRFAKVYGNALTPQVVAAVFAMADLGYMYQIADLLDELREKDTHLHSILQKRELLVAGAEYEVRPPAKTGKQAQNIADYCAKRLAAIEAEDDLGRSFVDALADLQGANYHGRAVLEAMWEQDGRWWYPHKLEFVHPRRCAYTSDWRLHLWDALGTNTSMYLGPNDLDFARPFPDDSAGSPFGRFPGVPIAAFPKGKFVVHRPRVRGVYPTREGLGRTVAYFAVFKRFDIRDWLAFAEWAGRGLRTAHYSTGGDPKNPARSTDLDIQAMIKALQDLSSGVVGVFPDTARVDIRDAPTNNDVHEKLLVACNSEMSKAVLGETLTTEVGVNGGSRAQGSVHEGMLELIKIMDAKSVAATIKRDILRPMVQRSFGMNAPIPDIVLCVKAEEDLDSMAARIGGLVRDTGLEVGQRYIREVMGIPEPTAGEEIVGGAETTPVVEEPEDKPPS